jgi:type I restriction enzyme S subunit
MNKLPKGWRWAKFEEAAVLQRGYDLPAREQMPGNYPVVTSGGINGTHNQFMAQGPGVATGRSGSVGRVHYIEEDFWPHNTALFVKDFRGNHPKFIYYLLLHIDPAKVSSHTGVPTLDRKSVHKLEIPLPPLDEQRRIVATLDERMAAIDRARAAAEAQLEAAQALPAAYLRQVFNSEEAKGWPEQTLNDVCYHITDGTHHTPTYTTSGVPFLSVKDVRETGISFDECQYISQEEHEQLVKRCKPEKGDVLYTKVGTTGIAKAIDVDREFSIFVSVALLKLKPAVSPEYIQKVLNSPLGRKQAEHLTQGMANRNLVIRDIKKIEIPVPPISEQERVTAIMTERHAKTQVVIQMLQDQLNTINALPGALLRQAFNGEL